MRLVPKVSAVNSAPPVKRGWKGRVAQRANVEKQVRGEKQVREA